jgi:hypothetical protein
MEVAGGTWIHRSRFNLRKSKTLTLGDSNQTSRTEGKDDSSTLAKATMDERT